MLFNKFKCNIFAKHFFGFPPSANVVLFSIGNQEGIHARKLSVGWTMDKKITYIRRLINRPNGVLCFFCNTN